MHFRCLRCHGFITFGRFSPSSVSAQQRVAFLLMSCICGTSTVFFRNLNLVLAVAVGSVDRIVCSSVVVTSRKCALSWLPTSRTMGCEFTHCGPLFSYPLWVRSILTRCGSALFRSSSLWCSSKLLGTPRCFRLSDDRLRSASSPLGS